MIVRNTIICIITMLMSLVAYGAEEVSAEDVLYLEAQVSHTGSRNKAAQRSLTSGLLYAEKQVSTDYSLIGTVYSDQEFKSVGLAVGKKFGDLQVAVGLGKAYYDGLSRVMPHGFVYYAKDGVEGLLYAEKYLRETVDSTFVKGYVTQQFGSWIIGGYGETGLGVGPLIGYKLTENVKFTFTVPLVGKTAADDGGMKFKATLVATF